jgi:hypothetical protein
MLKFLASAMKALSMKHASYSTTGMAWFAGKARRRHKGLFTIILEAIYESRRRQTEKTLRRYQHLIGDAELPNEQIKEQLEEQLTEQPGSKEPLRCVNGRL